MSTVTIKDKTFRTFIPEEEIQQRVKAVAEKSITIWQTRIHFL